jgi:AraC-like DNA-binding protein
MTQTRRAPDGCHCSSREQPRHLVMAEKCQTVIAVLELLEERYSQRQTSLLSIARELGISSHHLGRVFRRCTGQTFRTYLNDLRIRRAVLLLQSSHPIKAVAALVGYESRAHFYHEFNVRVGCTPAQAKGLIDDRSSLRRLRDPVSVIRSPF